jgi:small nuclear ribonucleoprotein (snRNP)-like protein
MDKKLFVHVQGGRKVSGTLRGYDLFLNLVIDDAQEETTPAQRHPIGTVVRGTHGSLIPPLIYRLGYPRQQCYFDGDTGRDVIAYCSRFVSCN